MKHKRERYEDTATGDIRRARAKLLARFNNDLAALVEYLKAEQAKGRRKPVNLHERWVGKAKVGK